MISPPSPLLRVPSVRESLDKLERVLAPLLIYQDFTTDQTVLRGTRVRGFVSNAAMVYASRPVDAVIETLEKMGHADPFVARYRSDEEIEIHPVFGGASLPQLLAWP